MSLPYAFLLFWREYHWRKSFKTVCTDNNHVVKPWICIKSSNIADAWKVTLLSCMHVVLCLFLPAEKRACFKIWVTLGSYFPVNKCFFYLCSGQKKPFQISSFRTGSTPRVGDSGTHCNNYCKQSNFLPVTEEQNKVTPVSNSEPTDKKCTVTKLVKIIIIQQKAKGLIYDNL